MIIGRATLGSKDFLLSFICLDGRQKCRSGVDLSYLDGFGSRVEHQTTRNEVTSQQGTSLADQRTPSFDCVHPKNLVPCSQYLTAVSCIPLNLAQDGSRSGAHTTFIQRICASTSACTVPAKFLDYCLYGYSRAKEDYLSTHCSNCRPHKCCSSWHLKDPGKPRPMQCSWPTVYSITHNSRTIL